MGVLTPAWLLRDAGGSSKEYLLPLNKLDATTAPGTGDDSGDGYIAGSLWVDVTADKTYQCVDNSLGAAVWKQTGGSGISVAWGGITGTLSDQTDLQSALNAKQPLDATLTAFSALTIAANSITVGTGADAFSQLGIDANSFPARTSTGGIGAQTITDFAFQILDDADAATVRTTIGAGVGDVTLTGSQTLTNKTLTTPTIGNFTNAQHDHSNASGGGTLAGTATAAATDSARGTVELATDAETQAGTDTARATTPANIRSLSAPTLTVYTSGSGTFNTPTNCKYLLVEMVGGGGGGGGSGTTPGAATAGGDTTFAGGTYTANGGALGPTNGNQGAGGAASGGDINISGGNGAGGTGTANSPGGYGGTGYFGGNGGGGPFGGGVGRDAAANSGGGGGGAGCGATVNSGSGGGAGGYLRKLIPSPSATYAYAVGAAGAAGTAGTGGSDGGAGSSGRIHITAYFI